MEGNVNTAISLIENKPDLELRYGLEKYNNVNIKNYTALHCAIVSQHFTLVELLINQGSSLTSVTDYENTALHLACLKGSLQIVEFLVNQGSNLDAQNICFYGFFMETLLFI